MLDMTRDTIKLLTANKLFHDQNVAFRQTAIGVASTAALLVGLAFLPVPLWISAVVAGFAGGYLMPYLFKDIRFK